MSDIKALIVAEDNVVAEEIQKIMETFDIEVHKSQEWNRSFSEQNFYSYYVIDQKAFDGEKGNLGIPSSAVLIGMTDNPTFEESRKWLKAGAVEVFVYPGELERLKEFFNDTIEKMKIRKQKTINDEAGNGKVSVFFSAKGGSGKTLFTTMIGQSLQIHHQQKVIIIDLNAQFGGVETMLGLEPIGSYDNLQPVIDELTMHHIENVTVQDERTGNLILLGPANPAKAEEIPEILISKVIQTCRAHFDHVLLDLPSGLDHISFTALNETSMIYYILTPDSLALRNYKKTNELFQQFQFGNKNSFEVLLNRVHAKNELTEKEIVRIIDQPIAGSVREDYFSIQPIINMGTPFFSKKKDKAPSKITKDIRAIVDKVILKG